MCRYSLPLLALFLSLLAGTPPRKVPIIEDKAVIPGQIIKSQPIMEVRNLRFFDAKLQDTGTQCTIVCGELWNLTDTEEWAVDIEIDLWVGAGEANLIKTVQTHIERPGKKVPIPFRLLAPASYSKRFWNEGGRLMHLIRLTILRPKAFGEK